MERISGRGGALAGSLLLAFAGIASFIAASDRVSAAEPPLVGLVEVFDGTYTFTANCQPDGSGTLSFDASGLAEGTYTGTYVEHGVVTFGPAVAGVSPVTGFTATFTIVGTLGGTTAVRIEGEKHLVANVATGTCSTTTPRLVAATGFLQYNATITSAEQTAQDQGVSTIELTTPVGSTGVHFEQFLTANFTPPLPTPTPTGGLKNGRGCGDKNHVHTGSNNEKGTGNQSCPPQAGSKTTTTIVAVAAATPSTAPTIAPTSTATPTVTTTKAVARASTAPTLAPTPSLKATSSASATPAPTTTPTATPATPTSAPTATPRPTPSATPTATPATASPSVAPSATPTPTPAPTPTPTPAPTATPTPSPTPEPSATVETQQLSVTALPAVPVDVSEVVKVVLELPQLPSIAAAVLAEVPALPAVPTDVVGDLPDAGRRDDSSDVAVVLETPAP